MMELSVSQLWCSGPQWLSLDAPTCSDNKLLPMLELCKSQNLLAVEKKPHYWRPDAM